MPKRDERQKASDVFRESNFLFGRKVSFNEAFPEIEDVTVDIEEVGYVAQYKGKRTYHKGSMDEYIDCSNPLCYNGGVSIGAILREIVRGKQTELTTSKMCQGYEVPPKGRRRIRDCVNVFAVKVSIKYKEARWWRPLPFAIVMEISGAGRTV